jgi:hypothetical protein
VGSRVLVPWVFRMAPLEKYLEQADKLAQDVVNAWGVNMQAGNGDMLSPDFKALLDKACQYRTAKSIADNHREFNILSERTAAEEQESRLEFSETYKTFWERREKAA